MLKFASPVPANDRLSHRHCFLTCISCIFGHHL